jgi:hypothetical protein
LRYGVSPKFLPLANRHRALCPVHAQPFGNDANLLYILQREELRWSICLEMLGCYPLGCKGGRTSEFDWHLSTERNQPTILPTTIATILITFSSVNDILLGSGFAYQNFPAYPNFPGNQYFISFVKLLVPTDSKRRPYPNKWSSRSKNWGHGFSSVLGMRRMAGSMILRFKTVAAEPYSSYTYFATNLFESHSNFSHDILLIIRIATSDAL